MSDAGDSGAVLVDTQNAEPVGLYFAGGTDGLGVAQGLANPAGEVLRELSDQLGDGASYAFVGGEDHPVSCLSYGDSSVLAAQARSLTDAEMERGQAALNSARQLIDPSAGILGVAVGKSSDSPGEAAVVVYVTEGQSPEIPQTVAGVRTIVVPTNARAVAAGAAPSAVSLADGPGLSSAALTRALAIKEQAAHKLMQATPAIFGIGVGQSLDNPREPALVIYVDRTQIPANLSQAIEGVRTHYVFMDRFHVTRSYAVPFASRSRCSLPVREPQLEPSQSHLLP